MSAIPLKNLRDPLGQNWDFFNPLAKNGYFPYPPWTQNRIFFYPPRIFFFWPSLILPPSDIFSTILPPSDIISWDHPRTKNCSFLPPRSKTRIFSTPLGHGDFFNGIALRIFWRKRQIFFSKWEYFYQNYLYILTKIFSFWEHLREKSVFLSKCYHDFCQCVCNFSPHSTVEIYNFF